MNFKKFWHQYTKKLGNTIFHPQYLLYQYKDEAVRATIKRMKGNVLDIGCGRMPYKKLFLQNKIEYVGLDNPETANLYDSEPDIKADAHNLPLKNASFDNVIMFDSLEYFEDPNKVFSEISRVIKDNGKISLIVPFMYPLHDMPYDRARYSDTQIKYFLKNNNFKIIKIKKFGEFWEFFILSFLVYLFKELKYQLKNKNYFLALLFGIIILVSMIPANILGKLLTLRKENKHSFENRIFPIGYFALAKKIKSNFLFFLNFSQFLNEDYLNFLSMNLL